MERRRDRRDASRSSRRNATDSFFKLIRKLHKDGKVGVGPTFHGLRHTTGKLLTEAVCTTEDIVEILGAMREMAEHYSAETNRKFRAAAAIEKLERSRPNFAKPEEPNCKTGQPLLTQFSCKCLIWKWLGD